MLLLFLLLDLHQGINLMKKEQHTVKLVAELQKVFADNEAAVADFKSGKRNADKAFTGFLMKATKGQANPQVALKLLAQELAKLKED